MNRQSPKSRDRNESNSQIQGIIPEDIAKFAPFLFSIPLPIAEQESGRSEDKQPDQNRSCLDPCRAPG